MARLRNVDGRFLFAERMIGRIPTGVAWSDVRDDVESLRWEAMEHAAALSALDAQLAELRFAPAGTALAVLQRQTADKRHEHIAMLQSIEHDAESLSAVAANAAAAAEVALARTGRLAALEVASPSPRAVAARANLAVLREHLSMLADVWTELDESGQLAAGQAAAVLDESGGSPHSEAPRPRRLRGD